MNDKQFDVLEKDAIIGALLPLMGRVASFGLKATGRLARSGAKGAVGAGKFVKKRPGLALTGAFAPLITKGYMDSARMRTLGTMKRKLPRPKFTKAGACLPEQGEINNMRKDNEYPDFLYEIDGFEKMAEVADMAYEAVRCEGGEDAQTEKAAVRMMKLRFGDFIKDEKLQKTFLSGKTLNEIGPHTSDSLKKIYEKAKDTIPSHSLRDATKEMTLNMSPSAIIATALLGAVPVGIATEKMFEGVSKNRKMERSYKGMLGIYPELRRENPKSIRRYFDYIASYSPTVAENPHAAGSIIKRLVNSSGMLMDNTVIEGLLRVEKTKSEIRPDKKFDTRSIVDNVTKNLGAFG